MKFDAVIIIGAGGTGSHLAEPLARLLNYHENGTGNISIIDGDRYEEKNETRQLFDHQFLGVNKAIAMKRRLSFIDGIRALPTFVNQELFSEYLNKVSSDSSENVLVITSVDNKRSRHEIINVLDQERENFVLLSPGNQYSSGHTIFYAKQNGRSLGVHPFVRYPDLKDPQDNIPGFGCQREAVSHPQLLIANAYAAVTTLSFVQNLLDGEPVLPDEVFFDSKRMRVDNSGSFAELEVKSEEVEVTELPEIIEVEVEVADTETPETEVADTETPETEVADTGTSEEALDEPNLFSSSF